MSAFNAFDLFDTPFFPSPFSSSSSSSSSFFCSATSLWDPRPPSFIVASERHRHVDLALDLLDPNPSLLDLPFLDAAGDLIHFEAAAEAAILFRRAEEELRLRSLCDRVTALELGFTRALGVADLDRKYKWTTEIKGRRGDCADRKYTWTAEAKGGEERALKWTAAIRGREEDGFDRKYKWAAEEPKCGKERNVKWTAEFKGKGRHAPVSHTYTFETSTMPSKEEKKKKEKKEEKKTAAAAAHVVEIEENNAGDIAMRKAFARSTIKGKRKELSAQDAALIIQMTFRAHLVRRSQVLRCLRDLAVAKAKLKELRALFSNFSYRRRITNDAEERQRFSEKIIVLLLTVDAIEGPDYMVRAAKKSMVLELEAMLEVVDPQPCGKLGSLKRRTFDLPDGLISKEMATGVAEVVHMIDREENE